MALIALAFVLSLAAITATNALPASAPAPTILAGGPATKPIPSNCTITDLAPAFVQTRNGSYFPTTEANNDILHSAYYPSFTTNTTTMSQKCLQQCHGYGTGDQCKTAFWAENMPVPEGYYGSPGGQLKTACVFFTRILGDGDFEAAPDGLATNAVARSLEC